MQKVKVKLWKVGKKEKLERKEEMKESNKI